MRPRIYEIIEIEDYKDNDKNLIYLPWQDLMSKQRMAKISHLWAE